MFEILLAYGIYYGLIAITFAYAWNTFKMFINALTSKF